MLPADCTARASDQKTGMSPLPGPRSEEERPAASVPAARMSWRAAATSAIVGMSTKVSRAALASVDEYALMMSASETPMICAFRSAPAFALTARRKASASACSVKK